MAATFPRHDRRVLIPLGEGVYTITDTCRILVPMSRSTVHYWLNTRLLSDPPVAHRGTGTPTLLTFRQLLEVRTVQHLRTELHVSLPRVREAFAWILESLFADSPSDVRFELGPGPALIVTVAPGDSRVVPTGQAAFPMNLDELNEQLDETRRAWRALSLPIPAYPRLVANAKIQAGSPTIAGTRVDTAVIAAFGEPDGTFDSHTIATVLRTYPRLSEDAVVDALTFEGLTRGAA